MTVYCKQRDYLLHFNCFITARSLSGRVRKDQLKVWLEVEDYDPVLREVTTRAGVWQQNDLDFINTDKES